jgi:hypothetical protein
MRFELDRDETDGDESVTDLDRLIALGNFVLQARAIVDRAEKLRALEVRLATATKKLSKLEAQAGGILEAAQREAEQIRKGALDEAAADRADREARDEQRAYQELFDRMRKANPAWTDHQIRIAIAESRQGDGTFQVSLGTSGESFTPGSTLTRNLPA